MKDIISQSPVVLLLSEYPSYVFPSCLSCPYVI